MTSKTKKRLIIIISIVLAICVAVGLLISLFAEKGNETPSSNDIDSGKTFTVTFYSDTDKVLKVDTVKENSAAVPPNSPVMTYGTVFRSWDTDFLNVTQDLDVRPICEKTQEKPNVIVAPGVYTQKEQTVSVPIQLCGDVCVSGLDITIRYDHEKLSLTAVTEDGGVVFNDAMPGVVTLNYVSVENTVADVDLCYLQFFVNTDTSDIPVEIEVNGIYAFDDANQTDELYIPESTVISGNVFVIG